MPEPEFRILVSIGDGQTLGAATTCEIESWFRAWGEVGWLIPRAGGGYWLRSTR
jgi:hypothetical protein